MTRVSVTDARLTARLYQETRERISKLVTGTRRRGVEHRRRGLSRLVGTGRGGACGGSRR